MYTQIKSWNYNDRMIVKDFLFDVPASIFIFGISLTSLILFRSGLGVHTGQSTNLLSDVNSVAMVTHRLTDKVFKCNFSHLNRARRFLSLKLVFLMLGNI